MATVSENAVHNSLRSYSTKDKKEAVNNSLEHKIVSAPSENCNLHETGLSHIETTSPEVIKVLEALIDEVSRISKLAEIELFEVPGHKKTQQFIEKNPKHYHRLLDERLPSDEMGFIYEKNLKAIMSLERLARRYKKGDDIQSFREIVRLLVAASGHDIHEVRNRASVILERILSPKEYDAPLAAQFINVRPLKTYSFEFDLPGGKRVIV